MQTIEQHLTNVTGDINLNSLRRMSWFQGVGLMFGYILLWWPAAILEYSPHASIWFPPAGWTFAAFLVFGVRALFPIATAIILTTVWSNSEYDLQLGMVQFFIYWLSFVFCHCLPYGLGASLLRQSIRFRLVRELPGMVIVFLILGILTSLLASFLGTQVALLTSAVNIVDVYAIWLARWVGDMTGVMVLTPIFMGLMLWKQPLIGSLFRTLRVGFDQGSLYHFGMKVTILLAGAYICILANWWFGYRDIAFAIFFLIIPQMWIAYTENPLRTAASLGLFSFSLAVGMSIFDLAESVLIYQFAVTVIASSVYFGLAVPVLLAHNRQLEYQAQTDYLTGISNRRHFMELASDEISRAQQYGYPVALGMFNIEHFERTNNTYGHEIGDRMLVSLVQAIGPQFRQADIFARFGGDDFFVLLPGLSAMSASRVLQGISDTTRLILVDGLDEPIILRYVVVQLAQDQSLEAAIHKASQDMLQQKKHLS